MRLTDWIGNREHWRREAIVLFRLLCAATVIVIIAYLMGWLPGA